MKHQFPRRWGRQLLGVATLGVLLVVAGCGGGGGDNTGANGGNAYPVGDGSYATYNSPASYVDAQITVAVSDTNGGVTYGAFTLPVVCCGHAKENTEWPGEDVTPVLATDTTKNHLPVIVAVVSEYFQIERGKSGGVRCIAYDPDGDELSYRWEVDRGTIK